jgi:protein-L-isoaspartate(D-aspartate) O-methyltransferase
MTPSARAEMIRTIRDLFTRTAGRTGLAAADPEVLLAMARVPRERFVPPESRRRAYEDSALSLACGQTISQPYIVALMTSLLRPQPQHRVLEVGTGSGYQAAILGELVAEVHTVEVVAELAASATGVLRQLGYDNVHVHGGDGATGWPEHQPYDGILVACGSDSVPPALIDQLAPGGHLVIPVGPREDQRLLDIHKDAHGGVRTQDVLGVRFVPLVRPVAPRHEQFADPRGVGLRAIAATPSQAFAQLALAITSLVTDPAAVRSLRRVEFACSAATDEQLLARWLDEVTWAMRSHGLVFASFDVRLLGDSLRATGLGEPLDPARHPPRGEAKNLHWFEPHLVRAADAVIASCCVSCPPGRR